MLGSVGKDRPRLIDIRARTAAAAGPGGDPAEDGAVDAHVALGDGDDCVVDARLRVHGLDALRVVDASIMPDCIRANTNITAMVIGERIAEFMQQGK